MVPSSSLLFVSQASISNGAIDSYNVRKRVEAVKNCRRITKHDMKFNGATPRMTVDPETFVSLPVTEEHTFLLSLTSSY
jgi:urease